MDKIKHVTRVANRHPGCQGTHVYNRIKRVGKGGIFGRVTLDWTWADDAKIIRLLKQYGAC